MNLGFYVHTVEDTPLNKEIYNLLNKAIDEGVVDDASLFYNQIDFNPNEKKFGTFNSTDLWSFNGTLVVTSLNSVPLASGIVNKIKLIYLYTKSEFKRGDLEQLMQIMGLSRSVPVLAKTEEDKKEFYRLTKQNIPVMSEFSAGEILKV
jgi:hypothetical protein|tara:strand:- start:935 stop:1381 length:447 start_codon:yes stop_codon:yes gene_type:complete